MWTISSDYQRNHLKEKRNHLDKKGQVKNKRVSAEAAKEMTPQQMDF